ncbi:MAG TPA: arylsulfatase, partial [Oceanipulchritudo sp.]|nr:arylsulfatase [Oceanipulchritudo sp.]
MDDRPNILFIISDQFRGDCLGCSGHPVVETPHLDQLAAEGAVFRKAYSPCPSCVPARRCLMTGKTPAGAGFVGYRDNEPWDYRTTLAGELTRGGYQTINIGKTHFYPERLHLGFERLITFPGDYEEWLARRGIEGGRLSHGVDRNSWMARPHSLPEHLSEEVWTVNKAERFLEKRDPTRPFFMCLSFNGPHPPWCPPEVYYNRYSSMDLPEPVVGDWAKVHEVPVTDVNAWQGKLAEPALHRARAAYFGYIAFIDAQIGRFMASLKRAGCSNTWVIFCSDHGEMLGDHHLWRKTYAYEPSARIPFIIRPPAGELLFQDGVRDELVGLEDVMPTLLDIAGLSIPEEVEGRSILALADGSISPRSHYHGEHSPCYTRENAHQFLTDGRWKYIWNPVTGAERLFDLKEDPAECRDLAGDEAFRETL